MKNRANKNNQSNTDLSSEFGCKCNSNSARSQKNNSRKSNSRKSSRNKNK